MSWASRRRLIYLAAITVFFLSILGGPLMWWWLSSPASCSDGIQNQGETAVDKGGPCPILDERTLQPQAILWSRSFQVRDGLYNAVAYVQNPNDSAGVAVAHYRFGLYDANNVLVTEREGTMFIMPGSVTPVIESRIDTGNRVVARTYFEFTEPLVWERMKNLAADVVVTDRQLTDTDTEPRITATAKNTSVGDLTNVVFVAVVFDPAGNAFAASGTSLDKLAAGEQQTITFTWPSPFLVQSGRVDILPIVAPERQISR